MFTLMSNVLSTGAPKHFNMGPFKPNLYALRIDIVIFVIDIHYLNMILLLEIETYM